ncbi:RNase H domain-containing protein [Trichonephila clavipes]|nr:RNase H domain-containing protein [Trichonephila clavipes]
MDGVALLNDNATMRCVSRGTSTEQANFKWEQLDHLPFTDLNSFRILGAEDLLAPLALECIEECQKNSSLAALGCLTDLFKVTGNERYCRQEADDKIVLAAAHECVLKNCRPACHEVSYEVLKDTLSIETSSNCFVAGIYGKIGFNNAIRVEIKLDGMQTTTYTYSPKYQLTSKIGVITRDLGETVPSAKWCLLTLPLVLGNLITCHNVLIQRMILCVCDGVFFHSELPVHVNKQEDLPAYLKQIALERIGGIPIDAIQRRNPDGFSVFRNELIAIYEALGSFASLPNGKEIWILSDSRSAIQHLSNWQSVRDNVGVSILTELKRLSTSHQIHLQWIPSHIDLEGNEIVDTLAKAGACELPEPSAPLTFLEIFSRTIHQNKTAWISLHPQEHHWYQCSRPRGSLVHGFTRQDQTLLAHFREVAISKQ